MRKNITAGIDIGGTKILAGILSNGEKLLAVAKEPTGIGKKNRSLDGFTGAISKALDSALKKSGVRFQDLEAVGIGCAGQIEAGTGDVLDSPHLAWNRIPLKRIIEERTGKPVTIVNDVQAAAWGEYSMGAGKASRNMVCIFAGTGTGSGIVVEGSLYRGSAGSAGEVGHSAYRVGGVKCKCGQRGCAEAYCGGESLWLRARKAIKAGRKTLIADMIDNLDQIPAHIIEKAARAGDPFAKRLWKDAELALGTIVHNCANILNPDTIILGGGIVEGLPYLRRFAADYVKSRAVPTAAASVKIVAPKLGANSAAAGAAHLAFIGLKKRK